MTVDPSLSVFKKVYNVGDRAEPSGIYQCQACSGEGVHTSDKVLPPCPHCSRKSGKPIKMHWKLIVIPKHLATLAGRVLDGL